VSPSRLSDARDQSSGCCNDRRGQDKVRHRTFELVSELISTVAAQTSTDQAEGERPQSN